MRWHGSLTVLSSLVFIQFTSGQTYSKCNPLNQSCPANPALGGSTEISFTSGSSGDFAGSGNGISYNSEGAQLTVSGQGDNPTISSKWYLMFGHVDMVFKAAPGVGMVSSALLISDDLDEVDWELLGANSEEGQTNYFGKGITGDYDRGSFVATADSQNTFHTYSIDWTADRIEWQFDGATVRTLDAATAGDQYPQSPMQVKIGSWAGGDSSNSQGTIKWAGGAINYADGPYSMVVQSISATDYSTGTAYQYSGTDGSWQQVQAIGGSVNPSGKPGSPDIDPAPESGSSSHAEATRTGWPWVTSTSSGSLQTSDPHLSTYLYNSQGHASKTTGKPSASSSAALMAGGGGCSTLTAYNKAGSAIVMTVPAGYKPTYNNQGSLVTPPPCAPAASTSAPAAAAAGGSTTLVTKVPTIAVPGNSTGPTPSISPYNPANKARQILIPLTSAAAALGLALLAVLL